MSSRVAVLLVLVGSVHAGFSLSWALGAHTWLQTVGPWAVELAQQHPVGSAVALLGVTAAKVAGVVVPLLVADARSRSGGRLRVVCRAGGALVAAYGGVNAVVAWLVLAGVIDPEGGYDRPAMLGHAFAWDPLFLAWGLLLVVGLRRPGSAASADQARPVHQGV